MLFRMTMLIFAPGIGNYFLNVDTMTLKSYVDHSMN